MRHLFVCKHACAVCDGAPAWPKYDKRRRTAVVAVVLYDSRRRYREESSLRLQFTEDGCARLNALHVIAGAKGLILLV